MEQIIRRLTVQTSMYLVITVFKQWKYNSSDGTFRYGMDSTKCLDAGSTITPCQGAAVENLPFWYVSSLRLCYQ